MLIYAGTVFAFIFGAIVGSFLNVVIYRYGTGQSFVIGRSKCFACRKTLAWYELLPIVSFVCLEAKCSSCQSKISWQYPLVEVLTGIIFAGLWWSGFEATAVGISLILIEWLAAALLVAIAVYDWHHLIIPDGLVYAFIGIAFIAAVLVGTLWTSLLTAIGLFVFFGGLWWFSNGHWMGFGDAKLAVGMGLLLGWPLGLSATVLAFWLGAVIGVVLILGQKLVHIHHSRYGGRSITMKTEIPFAPFLVAATIVALIFNLNVIPIF